MIPVNIGCLCGHQGIVMATALYSLKYFATTNSFEAKSVLSNTEFKKLRRLLQRKRHIKILSSVFCDYSMLVTLYKIGELHLLLLGTKGFHTKAKNKRFTAAGLRCRQNLKMKFSRRRLADYDKNWTKKRAPRAARLFSLIQPIKSLIWGVVFVILYSLISETKERAKYTRTRANRRRFSKLISSRVSFVSRGRACFFHLFRLLSKLQATRSAR